MSQNWIFNRIFDIITGTFQFWFVFPYFFYSNSVSLDDIQSFLLPTDGLPTDFRDNSFFLIVFSQYLMNEILSIYAAFHCCFYFLLLSQIIFTYLPSSLMNFGILKPSEETDPYLAPKAKIASTNGKNSFLIISIETSVVEYFKN